jgi:UDPglucose 6-dehydrogenase
MNEYQKNRCCEKILQHMHTMNDKKICILGFSYKKDTGDTRESSAIDIVKFLYKENANIDIYDPKASEKQMADDINRIMRQSEKLEPNYNQFIRIRPIYSMAVEDASAIIIATEWDDFKTYDYQKIYNSMKKPAIIFDGRLIFTDAQIHELKKIGFLYMSL